MKVRWYRCCFHHRPTVRRSPAPNTSTHRCQGWRRCAYLQQIPQRPFGRCRGWWRWMKVRWYRCCFHHRPTVRMGRPAPSTSLRCCQVWRRCVHLQQRVSYLCKLILLGNQQCLLEQEVRGLPSDSLHRWAPCLGLLCWQIEQPKKDSLVGVSGQEISQKNLWP